MSAHAKHDSHDDHSHGGNGIYLLVFAGLVVLTFLSYWIGNSEIKHELPQAAWAGMMAVSVAKAMLVALFFMHLKWEANWKYVLTIPALMMSTFLICMLVPDVGMRRIWYSEERMVFAAEPLEVLHGTDEHGTDEHGTDEHNRQSPAQASH